MTTHIAQRGMFGVRGRDLTETYFFAFNLDGDILQEDVLIGRYKCKGIEIL